MTRAVAAVVVALSCWYLVQTFAWGPLLQSLAATDVRWLAFAVAPVTLVYWVVRTLRWRVLLRRVGAEIPVGRVYLASAISLGLAIFTPLQAGEAAKVELLQGDGGLQRAGGYGTFLVERVLDFYALVALAVISAVLGMEALSTGLAVGLATAMVVGAMVALFVLRRLKLPGLAGQVVTALRDSTSSPAELGFLFALTIVCWLLVSLSWLFTFKAVALDATFVHAVMVCSTLTIVNVLSLVPGAVGISEAAGAELLMQLGYPDLQAQVGAVALRAAGFVALALALLHLALWRVLKRRAS